MYIPLSVHPLSSVDLSVADPSIPVHCKKGTSLLLYNAFPFLAFGIASCIVFASTCPGFSWWLGNHCGLTPTPNNEEERGIMVLDVASVLLWYWSWPWWWQYEYSYTGWPAHQTASPRPFLPSTVRPPSLVPPPLVNQQSIINWLTIPTC